MCGLGMDQANAEVLVTTRSDKGGECRRGDKSRQVVALDKLLDNIGQEWLKLHVETKVDVDNIYKEWELWTNKATFGIAVEFRLKLKVKCAYI